MIEPSIKITWDNGRAIGELNRLIQERMRLMGESLKDATVATSINVVSSVRAETKQAKKTVAKGDFIIEKLDDLIAGWRRLGGSHRRCVRNGKNGAANGDVNCSLCGPYMRGERYEVFRLTLPYYRRKGGIYSRIYIAPDLKTLEAHARKMVARHRKTFAGLARDTLGMAMSKLSTRAASFDAAKAGPKGVIANACNVVRESGNIGMRQGDFTVNIQSLLSYAFEALKRGQGSISLSFARAANKTAGILGAWWARLGKPGNEPICPFPEIKRAR